MGSPSNETGKTETTLVSQWISSGVRARFRILRLCKLTPRDLSIYCIGRYDGLNITQNPPILGLIINAWID